MLDMDSEEEFMPSMSSQPPTKRPNRDEGMLAFLKVEAQGEEARDATLYEQNESFLALIAQL